jgi:small-conductance mechanosensitive channel
MIVRESERLKTKQEYQLQELERLQKLVQEQADTILNLEEEIEELEEQVELLTTQQITLSEAPMNTFLQVATPLLQQGGALLMGKALEYFGMIPKQEQQPQVMAPPANPKEEPVQTLWGFPVSEITQLPINENGIKQN